MPVVVGRDAAQICQVTDLILVIDARVRAVDGTDIEAFARLERRGISDRWLDRVCYLRD